MSNSVLVKELCDHFIFYYDGIKAQKDIDESPLWYYKKTTHVLKLVMEVGLLKELCELLPKHTEWIVSDILENILPETGDSVRISKALYDISEKIDLTAKQIYLKG